MIWRRATAKAALACASLVFDESWLDSPDAVRLREWLWSPEPRRLDGTGGVIAFPSVISSDDPLSGLCPPPKHLLFFLPVPPGDVLFNLVLFGTLRGTVSLSRHGQPPPWEAWRMDPHRPVAETTFWELSGSVISSDDFS